MFEVNFRSALIKASGLIRKVTRDVFTLTVKKNVLLDMNFLRFYVSREDEGHKRSMRKLRRRMKFKAGMYFESVRHLVVLGKVLLSRL